MGQYKGAVFDTGSSFEGIRELGPTFAGKGKIRRTKITIKPVKCLRNPLKIEVVQNTRKCPLKFIVEKQFFPVKKSNPEPTT
jgi:hypothetical protein